jgi:hypothetical protein
VAAHDLQEPLRNVQARDYLARMLAATGRMRVLIDVVLRYARATGAATECEPVGLSGVFCVSLPLAPGGQEDAT